jgi:hypothetical protein
MLAITSTFSLPSPETFPPMWTRMCPCSRPHWIHTHLRTQEWSLAIARGSRQPSSFVDQLWFCRNCSKVRKGRRWCIEISEAKVSFRILSLSPSLSNFHPNHALSNQHRVISVPRTLNHLILTSLTAQEAERTQSFHFSQRHPISIFGIWAKLHLQRRHPADLGLPPRHASCFRGL